MSKSDDFYRLVHKAREHCAGDSVQALSTVRQEVREAIDYGYKNKVNREYLTQLNEALTILESARVYADRISADTILCSILNAMNEGGEW